MMSSSELTNKAGSEMTEEGLKLLSVNAVSKILKIRSENVMKLIEDGKLKVIIIGSRIKIPFINLMIFINENSIVLNQEHIEHNSINKIGYLKNGIDSIIKNPRRRK